MSTENLVSLAPSPDAGSWVTCRNPDALALMMPGGAYETCLSGEGEHACEVFARHPRTLSGIYSRAAQSREHLALVSDGKRLTAGQFFDQAGALAAWLREAGVDRGDAVGLALLPGAAWSIAFVAVTAIGARAALINTRGAGEEMADAIFCVGATLVLAENDLLPILRPYVEAAHVRLENESAIHDTVARFGGISFEPVEVEPEHGAAILFTSGTTGRPKPVLHTHGSLAHTAVLAKMQSDLQDLAYERETGIAVPADCRASSGPTVIAGPMFHFSGVSPFLRGMYCHAPLFMMRKWDAVAALDLMEAEPVSRLAFVPAMLFDMINSPRANDRNLGSIRLLSNGAAALDPRIVAKVRARMPAVMLANTYGQTESGGWGTSINGSDYLAHGDSAGYVMPTLQARIVDREGRVVDRGECGEILLRGASVMKEYIGYPEATAATLSGGWLHTGDIGRLDAEDRLFIVDRAKNMIISGGENVYSAEVERVIGDYPGVREVIVYGLEDERLGERVTATVVPEAGSALDPDELKLYARGRLAGYKVPKQIFIRTDPLPRTSTMKVDRGVFLAGARQVGSAASAPRGDNAQKPPGSAAQPS